MARIDRGKRALGGAIKRSTPSRAATILAKQGLMIGRALDYGCGYGLDAATFDWDAYDPYYRPAEPAGPYDTIVCTLVLNALSRNNRAKVLARIQALLAEDGQAYLGIARDLPLCRSSNLEQQFSRRFRSTSSYREVAVIGGRDDGNDYLRYDHPRELGSVSSCMGSQCLLCEAGCAW